MSVIMPGSYDPVTAGHVEMIRRVAERGDEVYVVIFTNPKKTYTFSLEDRVAMLMIATEDLENVFVSYSLGYVVDYMREHDIGKIVKGYRTEADLAWEREQAEYNMKHGGYAGAIAGFVAEAIAANPKPVEEFKAGNGKALQFLVGQVMKLSRGKANPQMAVAELKKQLQ